jgi:hypothetical protein
MAVFDVTHAELSRLESVDTVEGQVALVLARQLDDVQAGMAVSADANTLVKTMQAIRDAQTVEADSVDNSRDEAARILRSVG